MTAVATEEILCSAAISALDPRDAKRQVGIHQRKLRWRKTWLAQRERLYKAQLVRHGAFEPGRHENGLIGAMPFERHENGLIGLRAILSH